MNETTTGWMGAWQTPPSPGCYQRLLWLDDQTLAEALADAEEDVVLMHWNGTAWLLCPGDGEHEREATLPPGWGWRGSMASAPSPVHHSED